VLLLLRLVHNLALSHHDEARVADVGCVHGARLAVQYQHTSGGTAC
jgi:hypothetical protein